MSVRKIDFPEELLQQLIAIADRRRTNLSGVVNGLLEVAVREELGPTKVCAGREEIERLIAAGLSRYRSPLDAPGPATAPLRPLEGPDPAPIRPVDVEPEPGPATAPGGAGSGPSAPLRPQSGPATAPIRPGEPETPSPLDSPPPSISPPSLSGAGEKKETEGGAGGAGRRKPAEPIPNPPGAIDTPPLRAALIEFAAHRRRIGHPMTPRAWTLLFGHLERDAGANSQLAVLYAIAKCWRSWEAAWMDGKTWGQVAVEIQEPGPVEPDRPAGGERRETRARGRPPGSSAELEAEAAELQRGMGEW